MLRSVGKQSGESVESVLKKKRKATVGNWLAEKEGLPVRGNGEESRRSLRECCKMSKYQTVSRCANDAESFSLVSGDTLLSTVSSASVARRRDLILAEAV